MKVYRAVLHLYPRSFRREFGDDMVLLAEEQLRDESTPRVVARILLDLAITVPARHLESHMSQSSSTPLVIAFVAVATLLIVVGGPLSLIAAVALLALATVIWRRSRPVVAVRDSRWWRLLLAGVGLLVALVIVTTITGELPHGGWYVAMATLFTSFALIGSGIVLGITGRFAR